MARENDGGSSVLNEKELHGLRLSKQKENYQSRYKMLSGLAWVGSVEYLNIEQKSVRFFTQR